MSMVLAGWQCWRVYFSDEVGDEVLTAWLLLFKSWWSFLRRESQWLLPVWMHYVPLWFPWHFALLGPNNCSFLARAMELKSKLFQLGCSSMTRPVMKLNLALIWQSTCVCEGSLWLWFVFKASQDTEKSSIRLDLKRVPACLKVRGWNVQCWDELSRTWSSVVDTCVCVRQCHLWQGLPGEYAEHMAYTDQKGQLSLGVCLWDSRVASIPQE